MNQKSRSESTYGLRNADRENVDPQLGLQAPHCFCNPTIFAHAEFSVLGLSRRSSGFAERRRILSSQFSVLGSRI